MIETGISALIVAPAGRLRDSLGVLLGARREITLLDEAAPEAIDPVTIARQPPALILLDMDADDGQSWRTLRQLKAACPDTPCCVVVHTLEQAQHAHAAHADAVLQAGFSAEALFATVGGLLGQPQGIFDPARATDATRPAGPP